MSADIDKLKETGEEYLKIWTSLAHHISYCEKCDKRIGPFKLGDPEERKFFMEHCEHGKYLTWRVQDEV